MDNLKKYLNDLIEFRKPVAVLQKEYSNLQKNLWGNYDIDMLKKEHIVNACNKFLNNEISAAELEEWADLIEGLESIKYESQNSDKISEMLFELSNPDINGTLTKESVAKLIQD